MSTGVNGSFGFDLRGYRSGDAGTLAELQRRCLAVSADMDETAPGFLGSPGFEAGRNIFCAVRPAGGDDRAADPEAIVGYGFVYRLPDPQYLYLDLRVDPDRPDAEAIRDALLRKILDRASEIQRHLPPGISTVLYGCRFAAGRDTLDYLARNGFTRHEPLCVLTFERDLTEMVPKVPFPLGVELKVWALDTEEERIRYLLAHNASLPYNYLDLDSFDHLLRAREMITLGAFASGEPAGSVTILKQDDLGLIEYLFVVPEWRGRGVGRCLVRAALRHFAQAGLTRARLDTGTENTAARALYESMGFRVLREAISMARPL